MTRRTLHSLIAALFVLSGAAGLVYQIVWFKFLSLFLGNTTYAQTIVLATFMGGLAVGASLIGKRADGVKHPLALYAWLEIGIGIYCLLYPWLMKLLEDFFVQTARGLALPVESITLLLLKFLISLVSLILPTILMGGTLPVLVKFMTERLAESERRISTLYFLNSLGAVIGTIAGGFFLLQALGLTLAISFMALLNLVIGFAAFLLAQSKVSGEGSKPARRDEDAPFPGRQIRIALLCAATSGVTSMMYEIAWVRLLIPVLGSTTYAFSLMLTGFISGITIGSWLISRFGDRIRHQFGFLAYCQIGVALSLLLCLPFYERLPYVFWSIAGMLTRTEATYSIYLLVQFLLGAAVMILPTIFLGMNLPVSGRIAIRGMNVLGKSIGDVFSLNTLGTVVGSLLAGLALIPLVGVKHTIEIAVLCNLAAGAVVLLTDPEATSIRRNIVAASVVAVGVFSLATGSQWNHLIMLSGVFRHISAGTPAPSTFAAFKSAEETKEILFYKEAAGATIGVARVTTERGQENVLITNGKGEASSTYDLPTQIMLGQLPLLFHPHPRKAMLLGLGSGITAGTMLVHALEELDCVEILPDVVAASHFFDDVNGRPLEDKRFRLIVEDGLTFLKLEEHSYDVIVSEPSNPWIAGIGSLYTKEFFELCRKRMTPDGIMIQWFHSYEMNDETFEIALRTFRSVFKNVTVWQGLASDMIFMGFDSAPRLDAAAISGRLGLPLVKKELQRIGVGTLVTLFSLQVLSEDGVDQVVRPGSVNTDDHQLVEFWAPKAFFVNTGVRRIAEFDARLKVGGRESFLVKYLGARVPSDAELNDVGDFHSSPYKGTLQVAYAALRALIERKPNDFKTLLRLADVSEKMGRKAESLGFRRRLVALASNDPEVLEKYAWLQYLYDLSGMSPLSKPNLNEYMRLIGRCIRLSADTVDRYRVRMGDMLFGIGKFREAAVEYERALWLRSHYKPDPSILDHVILFQLAKSYEQEGNHQRALQAAIQSFLVNREYTPAKDLAYRLEEQRRQHQSENNGSHR